SPSPRRCTSSRCSCPARGAPRTPPPEPMSEALIGLAAMMLLAFLRIPIALAMAVVGVIGYAYMRDWSWGSALAMAQTKVFETGRNYTLSVVPLFILMGNFVTRAGMSQELFRAAYSFIGHRRGGLAMATILATVLLCLMVQYVTWRDPRAGPRGERTSWRSRWATVAGLQWFAAVGVAIWLAVHSGWVASDDAAVIGAFVVFIMSLIYKGVSSVIALFVLVMGGIYGGVFTAVEGAGVGAFGAMVFALARRALGWRELYEALLERARTTSMLFLILLGPLMFA